MKNIYVNLKRFDISRSKFGVNSLSDMSSWAEKILGPILQEKGDEDIKEVFFFPEAHILNAINLSKESRISIGCQSVHWEDTEKGGNFGAFTTERTANAAKELGCEYTIIGHFEERNALKDIINISGGNINLGISTILSKKIKCAKSASLKIIYCIGELEEERNEWKEVLRNQIESTLDISDYENVTIAYEPLWSIGVGKKTPKVTEIESIVDFLKNDIGISKVVYGGGLKIENVIDIAKISNLDGGLIGLTNFVGEIGFYPEEYNNIYKKYKETIANES